jgi:hypothetical protein
MEVGDSGRTEELVRNADTFSWNVVVGVAAENGEDGDLEESTEEESDNEGESEEESDNEEEEEGETDVSTVSTDDASEAEQNDDATTVQAEAAVVEQNETEEPEVEEEPQHETPQQIKDLNATISASAASAQSSNRTTILVMGLPRSGSMALYQYFTCRGVRAAHHYCCGSVGSSSSLSRTQFPCHSVHHDEERVAGYNWQTTQGKTTYTYYRPAGRTPTCGECLHYNLLHGRSAFARCGEAVPRLENEMDQYRLFAQFDVETPDLGWFLPQHFALPLLHNHHHNDTIWILNYYANATRWAAGVQHWYSITHRLLGSFGHDYHSPAAQAATSTLLRHGQHKLVTKATLYRHLGLALHRAENGTEHFRRRDLLVQLYQEHLQHVRDYATRHGIRLVPAVVDDEQHEHYAPVALRKAFSNNADRIDDHCWSFNVSYWDSDWQDFSWPLR